MSILDTLKSKPIPRKKKVFEIIGPEIFIMKVREDSPQNNNLNVLPEEEEQENILNMYF